MQLHKSNPMRPLHKLREKLNRVGRRTGNLPIRVRLFLITFGVILLFLVIIFSSNTLLLQPYYNYMKEKKLTSTLLKISALDLTDADDTGYASDKLAMKLKSFEEDGNIRMIILDDSLRILYFESDGMAALSHPDHYDGARQFFNSLFEMSEKEYRGEGTLSSPAISRRRNPKTNTNYLSLYSVIPMTEDNETVYYHILMNTSLSAIEDAVAAFNDYALVLGIFAMIISGLVSVVLCSNFVRPILRINQATKQLADMDFSVKLEIRSNDELGQLAESINHLSSELENKIGQLSVANTQLKKDIEEKEKIDLMRREMISNISHEFKTPLAIIMGYCEGLQLNINSDEKDYYCSVISDEAVKLNSLAVRLLDLAELESDAVLDLSEFSLAELAEERLKTMSYIFSEHGITTGFSSSGNCTVLADCGKIEEVINNLLSNARHHTPDGGHISIETADEGNSVTCTVFNSGSHIPEESLERIWESFYKVDKARTRKYGGSGLGLKIVSSIIHLHGGSYSAENTPEGVLFRFTLPKDGMNDAD